ncbi:MAG: DUF4167 domain-containing protein [Alphaproteobacteria bacterium]|nr:DUF4167 domain-containing protein [Alphaproteobacteria bacterium]
MKQSNNRGHFRGRNNGAIRRNNNSGTSSFNGISTNTTLDSNGPCGKIRGNAFQIMEKYLSASKDALSSDDRILSERCLQHAEHYFRMHLQFAENEEIKRQAIIAENQERPDDIGNRIDEESTTAQTSTSAEVSEVAETSTLSISGKASVSQVSFNQERRKPIIKKVKMPLSAETENVDDLSDITEESESEEIKPLDMDLSFPDLSKLEQPSQTKESRPKRRYTPRVKKETSVA